ncbi:6,7,8-trihydroxycoumarin synthase-like [Vicia villosa]|uniref:6,7,8-trihydroxycoumarin synthase-like n=1 Tax=Vicia villosa TaxID=3911 RepID=UPI00273B164A|nr:6,7,8-trihydroxycoumarin synthase-like [Vicia villosa]
MSPLVIFPFALFLFIFLFKKHKTTSKKPTLPPGPKGLPFIGNLHQVDSLKLGESFYELSKQYGSLMFLKLGSKPTLVVSSAKMAKQVMKIQDLEFCNRPALISHMKLSYDGLDQFFAPYGEYWRHTKKISFIQLLSVKRVNMNYSVRKHEVTQLMKKISEEYVPSKKPVNLQNHLIGLASAILCKIAFGRRFEEEGTERSMFHDLLKEVQEMTVVFFYTDYLPHVGGIIDKFTGLMGRLDKLCKFLDGFYQGIIDEHLDPERKKLPPHEGDVIDALIDLKNDPYCSMDLKAEHIKPWIMNMLVAGTDTSSSAVVWAMSALMKNPRAMKKVQEEIRKVFGGKGFIEEEDVQQLPYLRAVIKETMRLYPNVPILLARETRQECELDGYTIPDKTLVYVNAWGIHRDPEVWENPEEFYPERFIGSDIDLKGQDFELIPFGSGRRICPGLNMGIATVELLLANLLYLFDWEMPEGVKREDIDFEALPGIVQHKKNPLCLVAKTRIACA